MRWVDGRGYEMKFFARERNIRYDDWTTFIEFSLYNIRSGEVFCKLTIYNGGKYNLETIYFFEEIKDELYTLIMRDIETEEAYSYDKWILPLLRNNKIDKLLK